MLHPDGSIGRYQRRDATCRACPGGRLFPVGCPLVSPIMLAQTEGNYQVIFTRHWGNQLLMVAPPSVPVDGYIPEPSSWARWGASCGRQGANTARNQAAASVIGATSCIISEATTRRGLQQSLGECHHFSNTSCVSGCLLVRFACVLLAAYSELPISQR